MRVRDRVVDLALGDAPNQLVARALRVLDPGQQRLLLPELLEQSRVRGARDDVEPPADEVRELARPRRAAAIDDQRLDLLVARAERHAVAPGVGDRQARGADLGFAGHEVGEHLVVDVDAQADAELLGIAARELVLDAARLVGAVIERGRRIAGHDLQLARAQNPLEDRGG